MADKTRTLRVPEKLHSAVTAIASTMRVRPGDVLSAAFDEYLDNHRDELTSTFDTAKKLIAAKDYEGLLEMASAGRETWAAAAVEEARRDRIAQAREAEESLKKASDQAGRRGLSIADETDDL